jgi:hypothetical protein
MTGNQGPAVLDPQPTGDIIGALGTLKRNDTGSPRSCKLVQVTS